MITKKAIVETLKQALEPLPFVNGMFEGGAIAFNREDQFSDIDLHLDVADDAVERVFPQIEKALLMLAPLAAKYEVPQPTWHGHHQTFYRLEGCEEWLMIDIAVMKHSADNKFLEQEIHGHHVVHFDKLGILDRVKPVDRSAIDGQIKERLVVLGKQMPMFAHLPRKSLLRGQPIDAISFYQGLILRPLLELIRIKYDPIRYSFGARYLAYYAPPEVVTEYERLNYVANPTMLNEMIDEAERWFWQLHAELTEERKS